MGFRGRSDGKESTCNAGDVGLILGWGRSPGEGNGYPLQYSCLGNPMDRGAWRATVHGITESQTQLSGQHLHFQTALYLSEYKITFHCNTKSRYNALFLLNWSVTALQCCVSCCCTTQRISHLYTYTHTSHWPLQVTTEHRAELPVLCSRFPLAIYFTDDSVCMSTLTSHFIPPSPPTLCLHDCSLHMCLYSCPGNRLLSRFHIYALARTCKPPECPATDERVTMWHVHVMEYYSVTPWSETGSFAEM